MDHGGSAWRLEVFADGDALRRERLAGDLLDALRGCDGLTAEFASVDAPAGNGRKGGGGDALLWVAVAATARPAARIVVTAIQEWCAKERHRRVELTYEGNSVTITGRPDKAQQRLVGQFLDKASSAEPSGQENEAE